MLAARDWREGPIFWGLERQGQHAGRSSNGNLGGSSKDDIACSDPISMGEADNVAQGIYLPFALMKPEPHIGQIFCPLASRRPLLKALA